jgi:hypothetical protein
LSGKFNELLAKEKHIGNNFVFAILAVEKPKREFDTKKKCK